MSNKEYANNLEIDEEEEKAERSEENEEKGKLKNENNLDINSIIIGDFNQAPKFLQENEYIKNGYVINCTSFKKALRCLFKFHNETINTWTHLLGSIFFIFLIFYTLFFVIDFNIQLDIIKQDLPSIENKMKYINEISKSISTNEFYNSIKNIHKSFINYIPKTIYEETINNIFSLYNEAKKYTPIPSILEFFNSFLVSLYTLESQVIDLINLDSSKTEDLMSYLNPEIKIRVKEQPRKELGQWPLIIIILSAFLCLFFSTAYHALKIISPIIHNISHRFDHGGISLLISGSCFPPYYYFFYYENKFKYFYLIEISVLGLGIFFYSVISSNFSKPKRRTFRGILFLIFGICTGIPIIHLSLFNHTVNGYVPGIKLINWYLGGISYITGAIIYILRFPEKKFKGKFDYIGSSHQIFHILVFLGATFHYFGSLDAYKYRFKNLS
jgi:adiponectin receptor